MHHQPAGAAFDVVLLLHVVCVVVGVVTTVTAAATAARLRRLLVMSVPLPEPVRRYFRPGFNWAGRAIWGIPVFGFALVAMSQGAYGLRDGWVLGGLVIFVVVVLLAEGVLYPAERRVQVGLATEESGPVSDGAATGRDATVMVRAGAAALVLLLLGTVLMIAQP